MPRLRSTAGKILTATAVLLAVLMVILDMTVVNVALPHMMGALGATPDQITWVLTSYIVAEAIIIPTSGFLAERFGRKRVILVSVAGFVVASMLCGQSQTLAQMVLFRFLQGVFGASVVPLSQAIMVDTFEAKNRGKAMAIWGIGILLGPIMGPTVGGFITDHLGWRWVFYVNAAHRHHQSGTDRRFPETDPAIRGRRRLDRRPDARDRNRQSSNVARPWQ